MSEYIEFKDEEIPKENPNMRNDIYHLVGLKMLMEHLLLESELHYL